MLSANVVRYVRLLMMRCLLQACGRVVLLLMDCCQVCRWCACCMRARHRHAVVAEARRVRVSNATATTLTGKVLIARGGGWIRSGQRR